MANSGWKALVERLTTALFAPASDPHVGHDPPNRFLTTMERVDAASTALDAVARSLDRRVAAGQERENGFLRELDATHDSDAAAAGLRALLCERRQLAARQHQYLERALVEVQSEQRRLVVLQDRLRIHAEALALRHELAAVRRSAAQARYDAGESLLGLSTERASIDALLEEAET